MRQYVLAKNYRCYYGGEGRFKLRYDRLIDACRGAVEDGNPVGFDIYVYQATVDIDLPLIPCMRWYTAKALVR